MRKRLVGILSSRFTRLALGLVVSALSLYLALRNVALRDVGRALAQSDLRFVLLTLVCVAINTVAKSLRWEVLLGSSGKRIGLWNNFKALLVGQMFNNLLPARIGDLSRVYLVGSRGVSRTFVLGTIAVEKVLDMLAYAALFVALLLLIPLPSWVNRSGYMFAGVTVAVTLALIVAAFQGPALLRLFEILIRWLPERFRTFLHSRARSGLTSLDVLHNRLDLAKLTFWTAIVWGSAVLNNYLGLLALRIHLPPTAPLLILIALQAGVSIPSAPGKIGIFEYICVLALSIYGVQQAQALSYGILLHGLVLLPPTLLGLLFLWVLGLEGKQMSLLTSKDTSISSLIQGREQEPTGGPEQ